MSTGGATWTTAGALSIGGSNTFASASGTQNAYFLNDLGWWTYTPASSGVLSIGSNTGFGGLFRGPSEAERHVVSAFDFDIDSRAMYHVQEGVEYHFYTGYTFTDPGTYDVSADQEDWSASPWLDNWQDLDNVLVVGSEDNLELMQAENAAAYQAWQAWMHLVIRRLAGDGPGREGVYGITEVFGGDDPNGGMGCAWDHAQNGEYGGQLWSGTDQDPGSPSSAVCLALGSTSNSPTAALQAAVSVFSPGPPPEIFEARFGQAAVTHTARAMYWLPVKDNLPPQGAIPGPTDPEADGYPADSVLEWEFDYCDLAGVEFTTDIPFRDTTVEETVTVIRDQIHPGFTPSTASSGRGGDYTAWPVGLAGTWDTTGDALLTDRYSGGIPATYTEIDNAVAGTHGWDNANAYKPADPDVPDEVAVITMASSFDGSMPADGSYSSAADLALRFNLIAARYRWVYSGPPITGSPGHRRVVGRDAWSRVFPQRSQQRSNRVAGTYL